MKNVEIEKVTLNIGAGKSQDKLEKGIKLLQKITGLTSVVKTVSKKRIPGWGVRPGLPVGCMITVRKGKVMDLVSGLLKARDSLLQKSNFDMEGNISFGLTEYIDIPNIKYDPDIGIMGLQVCISLKRKAGYRLKFRKEKRKKIPTRHRVTKENAIGFMKEKFEIKLKEEE